MLRLLRAERGLTLEEAARRTGVTRETLGLLERGKRHPHTPTLSKIASGYGVSLEALLDLKENEYQDEEEASLASLGKVESPRGSGHSRDEILSGGIDIDLMTLHHLADLAEHVLERGMYDLDEIATLSAYLPGKLRTHARNDRPRLLEACSPSQRETLEDIERRLVNARDAAHVAYRKRAEQDRLVAESEQNTAEVARIEDKLRVQNAWHRRLGQFEDTGS